MTVLHILKDTSFDQHATRIMGVAFDSACASLGERGRSEAIQKILANCIVEVAKMGERDPYRLCNLALAAAADPERLTVPAEVAPLQLPFRFRP